MAEKNRIRKSRLLTLCHASRISANPRIAGHFLETVGRSFERPGLEIEMTFTAYALSVDGETAQGGVDDVFTAIKEWFVQIIAAEEVQVEAVMCFFCEDDKMSAIQKCCQRFKAFADAGPVVQDQPGPDMLVGCVSADQNIIGFEAVQCF